MGKQIYFTSETIARGETNKGITLPFSEGGKDYNLKKISIDFFNVNTQSYSDWHPEAKIDLVASGKTILTNYSGSMLGKFNTNQVNQIISGNAQLIARFYSSSMNTPTHCNITLMLEEV